MLTFHTSCLRVLRCPGPPWASCSRAPAENLPAKKRREAGVHPSRWSWEDLPLLGEGQTEVKSRWSLLQPGMGFPLMPHCLRWSMFRFSRRTNKGRVSGTGSDRRWYIDKVNASCDRPELSSWFSNSLWPYGPQGDIYRRGDIYSEGLLEQWDLHR